ncbi:MAG: class I SAM-dependent methyltransferase [Candidatus Kerfeldbacteria bacterium]|nr:class I SAM-dependent methyltransferase [Candidatus Kerfeldbacteria bacterium]
MTPIEIFLALLGIIIFVIFATAALAGLKAAPYVPTYQRDVRRMLKLADVRPDELVVDLGAGDGRFLLTAAAEFKARGLGFEFSFLPFVVARLRIIARQLQSRVRIMPKDFFSQDLAAADVVTCFLTPAAMKKLEPKFQQELRPGARIVSYAFKLPTWVPSKIDKPTPTSTPVFLYRVAGQD